MNSATKQLILPFCDRHIVSLDNFVSHSGIDVAYRALRVALESFINDSTQFFAFYLYGAQGTGKTHLLDAIVNEAQERIGEDFRVLQIDLTESKMEESQHWADWFIRCYEELRTCGGMVLLSAREHPQKITSCPHLGSRFMAGQVMEIEYPSEAELQSFFVSLLEKRGVRLPERQINYLLARLPASPLFFSGFFAKVDRVSLSETRALRFGLLKELIEDYLTSER